MPSPNNIFSDLDRARLKRAELAEKAAQRREHEAAQEAEQDRLHAEAAAEEQAKRDEAEALTQELAEADAAVSAAERQIELDRVAKVKADAETPEIISALWDRAEADHAALLALKADPWAQLKVRAALAMRSATGLDVPAELFQIDPGAGINIATLPDFCGLSWRVQRIAPETANGLPTRDTFIVRLHAGASLVTITHPGILADVLRQYPSLKAEVTA